MISVCFRQKNGRTDSWRRIRRRAARSEVHHQGRALRPLRGRGRSGPSLTTLRFAPGAVGDALEWTSERAARLAVVMGGVKRAVAGKDKKLDVADEGGGGAGAGDPQLVGGTGGADVQEVA